MAYEKSVIDEANRHLKALSQRVSTLENTVQEQAKQLILKDKGHQEELQALCSRKDSEISQLKTWLEGTQAEIRRMKAKEKEQEMVMSQLRHRCNILKEASKYCSSLEGLLTTLVEGERLCNLDHENLAKRQFNESTYGGTSLFLSPSTGTENTASNAGNSQANDSQFVASVNGKDLVTGAETVANGSRFSITEDCDP